MRTRKKPEIFFISYPDSLHCKNLLKNPSMGLTIFKSNQVWGKSGDRGMQLFGTCRKMKDGHDHKEAESVYGARFKLLSKWKKELKKEQDRFPLCFYRFTPERAKILDEKEFGEATLIEVSLGR